MERSYLIYPKHLVIKWTPADVTYKVCVLIGPLLCFYRFIPLPCFTQYNLCKVHCGGCSMHYGISSVHGRGGGAVHWEYIISALRVDHDLWGYYQCIG